MFKVYVTISKNFIILLNGYLNNHLTDPEFNGTLMIQFIKTMNGVQLIIKTGTGI